MVGSQVNSRDYENKYQRLVDSSINLIFELAIKYRDDKPYVIIDYISPACEAIFEYTPDEMQGIEINQMRDNEADILKNNDWLQRIISGEILFGYEDSFITKTGKKIVLLVNNSPKYDNQNNIIGTYGTAIDITDRKRAQLELEEANKRLYIAQKMEAVGRLASGVAHDFNNLLTVIKGNSEMLLLDANNPQYIHDIIHATKEGSKLVKHLLSFSKIKELKPEKIDLNKSIKSMSALLRNSIAGIDIKYDLSVDLNPVFVDPAEIGRVLMNLIINSQDAMPEGGEIMITTKNSDSHVFLSVQDNGPGMDEETKKRLFEPFYTTKGDKGTGIGLAIVYSVISQSNGEIQVDSEVGKGTTFNIKFPTYNLSDKAA